MNNERIYYSHDAEMHARRDKSLLTVLFLTLGLGIGAAFALLFAPLSGKRMRHEIGQSVEEGLHTGREAVQPLVKQVEQEFVDLKKKVEDRLK
jgi:gas vesicle protein